MITTKQYYAFISYKRDDQKWAEWLQEKLEHYKLPSNLNGRGDLPKEIRPVFRDKSELAAGVLADEIQKALDNSKYLIVICSPHSAKSEWVNKEVQSFIDSGRTDKIIPFIIEGVPNSNNDETECFPKAIRELPAEDELLGVNIKEMGRDAAAVKVVAQMFGLRFDDLWQRHEREKKRKRILMITAGVVAFLAMAGVAFWRQQTLKANWKMLESQSRTVSKEVIANAKDDSYLARMVALEILPKNVCNPTDRPYTAEAERALRIANGHNSAILRSDDVVVDAVFSPDSERITAATMTADSAFTVKSFDVESGQELRTIIDNDENIDFLKLTDNGKHIITANHADSTIKIMESDGSTLKTLKIKVGSFNVIEASDDMKRMLVIANDSTMHLLNIESGAEIVRKVPFAMFNRAAFSKDGKKVACSFCNGWNNLVWIEHCDNNYYSYNIIKVFDTETGEEIAKWHGHRNMISSLNFIDNEKIISASFDGTVKMWNATNGLELSSSATNTSSLLFAQCSDDGGKIVATSFNGVVILMDENLGEIMRLSGHAAESTSAHFSHDNKKMVSVSADKTVRMWDVESLEDANIMVKTDLKHNHIFKNCDLCGNKIAYYQNDSTIIIKDLNTWDEVCSLKTKMNQYDYFPVDLSCDGKYLAAFSEHLNLKVFDVSTGEEKYSIPMPTLITATTFSPDNQNIAISMVNGNFGFANLTKNTTPKVFFEASSDGISKMMYSDDGRKVYLPTEGKIIRVWDAETLDEICVLKGHTSCVMGMFMSPDGKHLFSASMDRTIKKRNAGDYKVTTTFVGHTDWVFYVACSPDGKYIATASADKTIRVWDTETGDCLHVIEGHTDIVNFVAFTPDGKHIISAGKDGTIRQWDFPPLQDLIDQTRERFKNRPLTEEERKMYYLE